MKKIHISFICLFFVFCIHTNAQKVAGYCGKHWIAGYNLSFSPAFRYYLKNDRSVMSINIMNEITVDYIYQLQQSLMFLVKTDEMYLSQGDSIVQPTVDIQNRYYALKFGYSWGSQRIIFNKILLNMGIGMTWVWGGQKVNMRHFFNVRYSQYCFIYPR